MTYPLEATRSPSERSAAAKVIHAVEIDVMLATSSSGGVGSGFSKCA
jgi:hypothetical protein